jgi:hypothetical protein
VAEASLAARLEGGWRLVATQAVDPQGRDVPGPYGPEPVGRLVLTASGRMMGMISDARAMTPAGQGRTFTAYCGRYEATADTLTIEVDGATNPDWIGGRQERRMELGEGRVTLTSPRRPTGELCSFVYEREGPV